MEKETIKMAKLGCGLHWTEDKTREGKPCHKCAYEFERMTNRPRKQAGPTPIIAALGEPIDRR